MDTCTGDGARWLIEPALSNSNLVFLTFHELHHLAEVIFMMVAATCANIHLPCCLLHFLSYILTTKTEECNFCNFALASASLVCLSLIGKRRQEDKRASDYSKDLVGWINIGVIYSLDDFVDAVYIRCIHAYWRCTVDSDIILAVVSINMPYISWSQFAILKGIIDIKSLRHFPILFKCEPLK